MSIADKLAHPNPDDRMSARARGYMAVAALRNASLGILLFWWPEFFRSRIYVGIAAMLDWLPGPDPQTSLIVWGVLFTTVGIVGSYAAARGEAGPARVGLLLSLIITGVWCSGFVMAAVYGDLTAPSALIIWATLALKDLLMLGDPLRVPFEDPRRSLRPARGAASAAGR